MATDAFLVVEKGTPYSQGQIVPLGAPTTLIGRRWADHLPDIAFDDPHVSRSHADIAYDGVHYVLRDLPSSRHGTEVNGKVLLKGAPYTLRHSDTVCLAKGHVVLRFCCPEMDAGETAETTSLVGGEVPKEPVRSVGRGIVVDEDRREVLLDGKRVRPRVVGREFELALLLCRNRGKAVSHEEIIEWVWRNVPNRETITRQDVTTLVHRLRRCLGRHSEAIVNVPGYGYLLE